MNLIQHIDILLMGISFLPIAHLLGRLLLFKVEFESFAWKGLVFQAVGFGVLSYFILALGLAGILQINVLWIIYWVLLGLSSLVIFEWWGWIQALIRSFADGKGFFQFLLSCLGLVFLLVMVIATLAPEVGGDALTYHLGTPKAFLQEGRIDYFLYDVNSIFPSMMQMLYLLGIALKSELLAKFFHLEMGFLLFTGLFLFLKDRQVQHSFFWSLLFILTPGLMNQIPTAHNDVGLALYVFLGVIFFFKALDDGKRINFLLGGVFFGLALSIKVVAAFCLPGLIFLGCLAKWFSVSSKQQRFGWLDLFYGLLFFGFGLLLACGVWYLRAYLETGNPFFPHFGSFFGVEDIKKGGYELGGLGRGILEFFLSPWHLVRYPEEFGGRIDQIGPFFIALIPFLVWGLFQKREGRFFAGVGFFGFVVWFLLAQRSRFLYPLLPLFTVAGTVGYQAVHDKFPKMGSFLRSLFWIPLIGLLFLACFHNRYSLRLAAGTWTERDFLETLERTTVLTDYLHHEFPDERVKILNDREIHRYRINRPIVRGEFFAFYTRYWEKDSPEEVRDFLKAEGFTHVLWAQPVGVRKREFPAYHIRRLVQDPVSGPRDYELIFEARKVSVKNYPS